LIDKGDEKASDSSEFFKFFSGFIEVIIKSMPKEEKKKPAASAAGAASKKFNVGPGAAGAGGDQKNNLMAELKMKQQVQQQK
jgi:hypothetical protein